MDNEAFNTLKRDVESMAEVEGLTMTDLLTFPDDLRLLLNWMMRENGVQIEEMASYLAQEVNEARMLLEKMIEKGLIEEIKKKEEEQYQVLVKSSRNYRVPKKIWQVIE
jgi:hypothetical protein